MRCGPRARHARRDAAGFTLIEVMVVVVILGVLAGVAAPQFFGSAQSLRGREAATQLYRTMQYARSYAVTRQAEVRLLLQPDQDRYVLQVEPDRLQAGDATSPDAGWQPLPEAVDAGGVLPDQVRFGRVEIQSIDPNAPQPTEAVIAFHPDGSADAALLELGVVGDGEAGPTPGNIWTLRLAPTTGRADLTRDSGLTMMTDRIDLDL